MPNSRTAPAPENFDLECGTLIVGAGACGLVAALSAKEAGREVLVVEADAVPSGSTALSAGLIPAAGTRAQAEAGIEDSADLFAKDIQAKAHGENEDALVTSLTQNAPKVIDWLTEVHGLPFSVVANFDYPGHSRRRMHGLPTRSGAELIDALRTACEIAGIDIVCERRAERLCVDGRTVRGVAVVRPDGVRETIGCSRLILACNGFGGNRELVAEHMPDIRDGLWFGHDGNRGEALLWGRELGAELRYLGAYQGHGNVAHPHGILITWAVITEGGVQVNKNGRRFWNEAQGYSEAARAVLAQPGGEAFAIFDARIADIARQFEDFKRAEASGAVKTDNTVEGLAAGLGLPAEELTRTIADIPVQGTDGFGRSFSGPPLQAPFCGVRVTGALFHTQGGLRTDGDGRVLDGDGAAFPNLFAAGGAACGVSGKGDSGYLSGNGLLSAVVLGWLTGRAR
ncbi:FAD-dependent oxidoreductase [Hoeflea prorocentri]|uniref:FAD-dependent oxidoreductase n=1 Tax=Hoeflea prorocentri TaxID=1922333 RepID=A0A9X3ZHS0_9HYPH|nr:FAD-dependent oxidoreductase [Hoeflea prorocentri]MCY6382137.1 FAD-dependent oxidoreductase [Hoeflea prorocentri]MDA5399937.1 FAD-dependent oxidoreductase [Hoeflea prorocentri]